MTGQEINILIMFGGVLLFASTIGIYDLLAERQTAASVNSGADPPDTPSLN